MYNNTAFEDLSNFSELTSSAIKDYVTALNFSVASDFHGVFYKTAKNISTITGKKQITATKSGSLDITLNFKDFSDQAFSGFSNTKYCFLYSFDTDKEYKVSITARDIDKVILNKIPYIEPNKLELTLQP
ncbi:hypothetical protein AGMMS49531_10090 [Endomicrobiia bacterium]|nr:hypothetical protein AGMMS49531_10090 [Endomicrobiia bacterium]